MISILSIPLVLIGYPVAMLALVIIALIRYL